MGRKDIKGTSITVKIDEEMLKEIDLFAKKMKLNRSQIVRNLISAGLDDLRLMSNTGMLSMAIKGYDLLEIVKDSLSKKKFIVQDDDKLIIDL